MIQDKNNPRHYIAGTNKTFIRKVDEVNMGNELYLGLFVDGTEDTIDNYEERDIKERRRKNNGD